jgi:hypothetical protein
MDIDTDLRPLVVLAVASSGPWPRRDRSQTGSGRWLSVSDISATRAESVHGGANDGGSSQRWELT